VGLVAASVTGVGLLRSPERPTTPVASEAPSAVASSASVVSPADLAARCAEAEMDDRTRAEVFAGEAPRVVASVPGEVETVAVLAAADGEHWAVCSVRHDAGAEFSVIVEGFSDDPAPQGFQWGMAPGCSTPGGADYTGCDSFRVGHVDRLPPAVAAVDYLLADGRRVRTPTVDGFTVLNHTGQLPDGTRMTARGLPELFQPLLQVSYLDAQGRVIAAQRLDGAGAGEEGERVGDHPLLGAYPSRGEPLAAW